MYVACTPTHHPVLACTRCHVVPAHRREFANHHAMRTHELSSDMHDINTLHKGHSSEKRDEAKCMAKPTATLSHATHPRRPPLQDPYETETELVSATPVSPAPLLVQAACSNTSTCPPSASHHRPRPSHMQTATRNTPNTHHHHHITTTTTSHAHVTRHGTCHGYARTNCRA